MLAILQVAIGICFVFLLFSLIVSAGNELVQAFLSMRAARCGSETSVCSIRVPIIFDDWYIEHALGVLNPAIDQETACC